MTKASSAVYYTFTFALAFLGVITIALVLSVFERTFLEVADYQETVSPTNVAASTQVNLRTGYTGNFGYNAPLPQEHYSGVVDDEMSVVKLSQYTSRLQSYKIDSLPE